MSLDLLKAENIYKALKYLDSMHLDEILGNIFITLISQYEICDPGFLLNQQHKGLGCQA